MTVIFHIDGGLGKHIAATAMVKVIKKKYKKDKLHVVCAYPDVFLNNPLIEKVHNSSNYGSFYETYIKGREKSTKVLYTDPYTTSDFILEQKSLLEIWSNIFDLKYEGETPEIYLTQSEKEYYTPFYNMDKPILAIQPNGGPANQGFNYSWTRDIPEVVVNKIVEHYSPTHAVVHIKREDQKTYANTLAALDGFRSIAILLQLSNKRLLIDSFVQHLSKALDLKSTVCWVTTKPEVFGYELHDNIKSEPFTRRVSFPTNLYQPFSLSQDISSCAYEKLEDVFNADKIIKSIDKQ